MLSEKVIATGGCGGAGIGSGYDAKGAVGFELKGGRVEANGGAADATVISTGAGVGTGATDKANDENYLGTFLVSGGWLTAVGGDSNTASVGEGSNHGRPYDVFFNWDVSGGTIIADNWHIMPSIEGGSIRASFTNVQYNGLNMHVDLVTLKVPSTNVPVSIKDIDPQDYYGTNDIFADENGYVYLYLKVSTGYKHSAQVAWGDNIAQKNYVNYYAPSTPQQQTRTLKQDNCLQFVKPNEEPAVGGEAEIQLDSSKLPSGARVDYSMESGSKAEIKDGNANTAPDTKVVITATDFGDYTVNANAENFDTDMYWNASASYTGKITKSEGSLKITEDIGKVYDNTPVNNPDITKTGSGAVTYSYYDEQENLLSSVPVQCGTYTVKATMAADNHYGAAFDTASFVIKPRDITLGITAQQEGSSAKVLVKANNICDADKETETVKVTVYGSIGDTPVYTGTMTALEAETTGFEFSDVGADEYTIHTELVDSKNYNCPVEELVVRKNLAQRTITNIDGSYTATYGDSNKTLEPQASAPTDNDTWTCEIVKDSDTTDLDSGDTAVGLEAVDNDSLPSLKIQNAGTTILKYTLTDSRGDGDKVYNDATLYVTIHVNQKDLNVSSGAFDSQNRSVGEVQYGHIDELNYKVEYNQDEFVNGDTVDSFANGSLEAVAPIKTIGVGKGREIAIAKIGPNDTEKFYSRNYNIIPTNGTIDVTKADLTLCAEDVIGVYNGAEPTYSYKAEGLLPWDSLESAFHPNNELPRAVLDTETAGGNFNELKPGLYKNVIMLVQDEKKTDVASSQSSRNLSLMDLDTIESANYTVNADDRGDLTVTKGDVDLKISATSSVYNGSSNPAKYSVADSYDGTVKIVYYELSETAKVSMNSIVIGRKALIDELIGELAPMSAEPVQAGTYLAVAEAKQTDCFESEEIAVAYTISKATPEVDTPVVDSVEYKDGLTLGNIALPNGWAWCEPKTELQIGTVNVKAIFTPSDTRNYLTVERMITVKVTEGSAEPTPSPTDPSKLDDKPSSNGKSPATGDTAQMAIWLILMLSMIAMSGGLVAWYRLKNQR